MKMHHFLFFLGVTIQIFIPYGFAEMDLDSGLESIIRDVPAKAEKAASRRPFKFKGMNDSLQFTADALKVLSEEKTPKALPMSVWSSSNPLTPAQPLIGLRESQKQALRLAEKARTAYSQNCFAMALRAGILREAGDAPPSNDAWEDYLACSQEYSSFEREFLSSSDFKSLRAYAKKILRSQGLDYNEAAHQRLMKAPFYKKLWHFVVHPAREDRMINRFFIAAILGGALLFVVCSAAGVEVYRSLGVSLAVLYAAVWLSYGCWLYDRAYGLPWGLSRMRMVAGISGIALVMSVFELWTAWRYAHPPLEEGYRRCPHCKAVIVKLSVECERCRKKTV